MIDPDGFNAIAYLLFVWELKSLIALGPNDFLCLFVLQERKSHPLVVMFFFFFLFCRDAVSKGLIKVIQDDF